MIVSDSKTLLPLLFLISCFTLIRCSNEQLQVLLKLKSQLQSRNRTLFDSWKADVSPCNFLGVTCSKGGSVVEIDLKRQGLFGRLPADSICQLPLLEKLSLARNSLSGILNAEIRNCSKLLQLDLAFNELQGTVPDLSPLSELQVLNLTSNGFTGPFPWNSLSSSTNLVALSLGDNPFDKNSFPVEILRLSKLQRIYLNNCTLEGRIPPEIGNLTELVQLELSMNSLYGEIPQEISKLAKLQMLEIYENKLSGKFPIGFSNLSRLQFFDASSNLLEGDLQELRSMTDLISLQLFDNNLYGEMPVEFGNFKHIVNISLYSNNLSGTLPETLGSWSQVNFIDISDNSFTGLIPPDMCKQGTMKRLLMLDNKLSGEIPASYGNCRSLIRFRVSNNRLSGEVPAKLWGLPDAVIIDLARNDFEGKISADIKAAKSLALLLIGFNRFSGQLPVEISEAASLVTFDTSWNQLSGQIPSTFGDMKHLINLVLNSNKLSGGIPDELGSCTSLSELNLADNNLSGQIPASLSSLPSLNSLNLTRNKLSGRIPTSFSSMKLSLLDLSNNLLSGPIPEALIAGAYARSFDGNPGLCSFTGSNYQHCASDSMKTSQVRTVITCLIAGSAVLLASLAYFVFYKKRKDEVHHSIKHESLDLKSFQILTFTEQDVLNAVKQENLIGKGGSSNVYRLVLGDGKELAVKHIWKAGPAGRKSSSAMLRRPAKSSEFEAEVATLSSIRHVNVVKLFCSISSEDSCFLVYEYLPNGSLWDRLHGPTKLELDWLTRYAIALGAAKGLEYLHHGCAHPIIHRDVKSSNILLDAMFKPRIADFGLAKLAQPGRDSTHIIAGTHGYIAPEYAYNIKVNEKSDVYSFGIVLLELVTGKRPVEPEYEEGNNIVDWVMSHTTNRETLSRVVDSRVSVGFKGDAMEVLRIGILCTAKLPKLRPSMKAVVKMLEEVEPCMLIHVAPKDGGSLRDVQSPSSKTNQRGFVKL